MEKELIKEKILIFSKLAGLHLSEDELSALVPALGRSVQQAEELRTLIEATDEPAVLFVPARGIRST